MTHDPATDPRMRAIDVALACKLRLGHLDESAWAALDERDRAGMFACYAPVRTSGLA